MVYLWYEVLLWGDIFFFTQRTHCKNIQNIVNKCIQGVGSLWSETKSHKAAYLASLHLCVFIVGSAMCRFCLCVFITYFVLMLIYCEVFLGRENQFNYSTVFVVVDVAHYTVVRLAKVLRTFACYSFHRQLFWPFANIYKHINIPILPWAHILYMYLCMCVFNYCICFLLHLFPFSFY